MSNDLGGGGGWYVNSCQKVEFIFIRTWYCTYIMCLFLLKSKRRAEALWLANILIAKNETFKPRSLECPKSSW